MTPVIRGQDTILADIERRFAENGNRPLPVAVITDYHLQSIHALDRAGKLVFETDGKNPTVRPVNRQS